MSAKTPKDPKADAAEALFDLFDRAVKDGAQPRLLDTWEEAAAPSADGAKPWLVCTTSAGAVYDMTNVVHAACSACGVDVIHGKQIDAAKMNIICMICATEALRASGELPRLNIVKGQLEELVEAAELLDKDLGPTKH